MKIILILISILIINNLAIDYETKTLQEWYLIVTNKMKTVKWNHPLFHYSYGHNHYNVKRKINFDKNKNKILNFAQAMILIYGSGFSDLEVSKQNKIWTLMVNNLINFYKNTIDENYLECFKNELKKVNSDSPLVAGFDEYRMTISSEICKQIVDMEGLDYHISNVEDIYGKLTDLTGGAVDSNKLKQFLLTFVIIGHETDLNKNREIIGLVEELKDIVEAAFIHRMRKLDSNR